LTREEERLEEDRNRRAYWKRWGPYLSERQWGTVREDYSPQGTAWDFFTHDQARSRTYRWGEDGIAGICDNHQILCFAVALWNGHDPILKERLFGLSGTEGNHGEDVKEYYFYLDNTPTHSYMKALYKYPQRAFPYARLVEENRRRTRRESEFELADTGIFADDRYFDVFVEYAKASAEDLLVRIQLTNRAAEQETVYLLPTLWFRNTWSWGRDHGKPSLATALSGGPFRVIHASHPVLGERWLYCERPVQPIFTENETNRERLFGSGNPSPFTKDGINEFIVHGRKDRVNLEGSGTKIALPHRLRIGPGETAMARLRLCDAGNLQDPFGADYESTLKDRQREADEFYNRISPFAVSENMRHIQRQAFAGMLWNKQFYYYVVEDWLKGDPGLPPPPVERKRGRNHRWVHFYSEDVLTMPDKWEYPWFAAWDLAFNALPLAMVDPDFAKRQLITLTREWYMHPNGQIPAYEWAFDDVNPPVQPWAAWQVYKLEKKIYGREDRLFLERVFQKMLLNFTWWVNREDSEGNNIFQGGFLGLDNISVFNRSSTLPTGEEIEQADGTSWMGMYCLNMLAIALELAKDDLSYEDIASKFFLHFLFIAHSMNRIGGEGLGLWNEEDGFYYDVLHLGHRNLPLKVHSFVGLIPLFAVETLEPEVMEAFPGFKGRFEWFIKNRSDLTRNVASMEERGAGGRCLLSIVDRKKLRRILQKMLGEEMFLSPYGIRSVSKTHAKEPFVLDLNGHEYRVDYEPAESTTGLFGGNSNWRGPIWFPLNFLLIESLQKFHRFFGDDLRVELPTGSGKEMTLQGVAAELSQRLVKIFLRDPSGRRPFYGGREKFQTDPHWRDFMLFHEYFHGDNGTGLGASHQTGWTGLVANLIQEQGETMGR
jgi:hypothetical protein